MRDIKFRQINKNNKSFHFWGALEDGWHNPRHSCNYSSPQESEQYTGLVDKNGTDIYEGDILHAHMNNAIYVVKHGLYINIMIDDDGENPDCYGWYLDRKRPFPDSYGESLQGASVYLEVIGNIHENPELLEAVE